MEEIPKFESDYKYTTHIVLFSIIFVLQYLTKSKEVSLIQNEDEKKLGNKIFWKYLIILQIAKAAEWCLGPFTYEFLDKYHGLSLESIGRFTAISYLSNLLMGPTVVGYLNDKSDRKLPCFLYGILMCASCYIRQIKNPGAILFSNIFYGMCSSILYSSFESWFVKETNAKLKDENIKSSLQSSAFEKSMISDSITAVTVNFIVSNLRRSYGIQAPYYFSMILALISSFLVSTLFEPIENVEADQKVPVSKHEFKDVLANIAESLKVCYSKSFIILIGITESLLFTTLHIFIFMWSPALKELNPEVNNSEIFTLFMIALMLGGALFKVN
jgi:MFS family permease